MNFKVLAILSLLTSSLAISASINAHSEDNSKGNAGDKKIEITQEETEEEAVQKAMEEGFLTWKAKLKKDTINKGYKVDFTEELFTAISYSSEYLVHDKKQFRPQTFKKYYANAVNAKRIRRCRNQALVNKDILTQVEKDFLVPKEYIVALWAIETSLGEITGNYNVLSSLANLSYNKRRRKLFLAEFFAAIEVLQKNNINVNDFKGSWAGAIGQCQFLPSTYLRHGFDFNKDNKTNIWTDKEDVLASIANYLQNLGWNNKVPWGYEIKPIKDLNQTINPKTHYSLQYLVDKFSVEKNNNSSFSDYELLEQVSIVQQEDRFFITFKNFDLIKKWNNSTYFALTVGLLAGEIKK
jgi:membrane-bound lytic murein transglycosylase B